MYPAPEVLLQPSICFICERSRDEGEKWVDTHRNHDLGHPGKLAGRKYVCDRCALQLAEFYGFGSSVALEQALIRAEKAEAQVNRFRHKADELSGYIRAEILDGIGGSEDADIWVEDDPASSVDVAEGEGSEDSGTSESTEAAVL